MQQGNVGWLVLIENVFPLMWASLDAVLREEEDGIGFKQLHHLLRKHWNLLFHLIFWFQFLLFFLLSHTGASSLHEISEPESRAGKKQRQTDFLNLYSPQGPADVEKAEKWAIKVRFGIDTDLGLPSSIVLPSAQTWTLPLKFGFSINMSSWEENSVICLISLLPLLWHINIKNICEQIEDLPKHFSFYFT